VRTRTLLRLIWTAALLLYVGAAAVGVLLFPLRHSGAIGASWMTEDLSLLASAHSAPSLAMADYGVIWKRMGEPPAREKQPAKPKESQPVRQINYQVIATFAEAGGSPSYAVLRDPAGKQHLVCQGQTRNGLKIEVIRSDGVLIRQDGVGTFVPLLGQDKKETATSTAIFKANEMLVAARAEAQAAREPQAAAPGEVTDPFLVDREHLNYYIENMGTLLARLGTAKHHDEQGQVVGVQLVQVPPDSVVSQRGLLEGDVVKKVRDVTLTDTRQLFKIALDVLKDSPPFVDVVIERNGEDVRYVYEIQ